MKTYEFYLNSVLHNENGPAIQNLNRRYVSVQYWLYGEELSSDEYKIKLRKEKLKKLELLNK